MSFQERWRSKGRRVAGIEVADVLVSRVVARARDRGPRSADAPRGLSNSFSGASLSKSRHRKVAPMVRLGRCFSFGLIGFGRVFPGEDKVAPPSPSSPPSISRDQDQRPGVSLDLAERRRSVGSPGPPK